MGKRKKHVSMGIPHDRRVTTAAGLALHDNLSHFFSSYGYGTSRMEGTP